MYHYYTRSSKLDAHAARVSCLSENIWRKKGIPDKARAAEDFGITNDKHVQIQHTFTGMTLIKNKDELMQNLTAKKNKKKKTTFTG